MHECFPKHSRMVTARMNLDKETDEEGKKRGVNMERSKAGTKEKRSPDGVIYPNHNTIMNIIWQYFIRHGKSAMKFN